MIVTITTSKKLGVSAIIGRYSYEFEGISEIHIDMETEEQDRELPVLMTLSSWISEKL